MFLLRENHAFSELTDAKTMWVCNVFFHRLNVFVRFLEDANEGKRGAKGFDRIVEILRGVFGK